MKLLFIPVIMGALLMSACAPHDLLQQQANENKALATLHQAERKDARADQAEVAAKAAAVAASQYASTTQQQAESAQANFEQVMNQNGKE